jgi:hypothetical protein
MMQRTMRHRAVLLCAALTLVFSLPLLPDLSVSAKFLDSDVRAAAPRALKVLQEQGYWIVHMKLTDITTQDSGVCFAWEHHYRARGRVEEMEPVTTCV